MRRDGTLPLIVIGAAVLAAHLTLLAWLDTGTTLVPLAPTLLARVVSPSIDQAPAAPMAPTQQPHVKRRPDRAAAASSLNPLTRPELAAAAPTPLPAADTAPPGASVAHEPDTVTSGVSDKRSGALVTGSVSGPESVQLPSSKADYLNNPPPRYPAISRRLGEHGQVLISVLISKEGSATQAHVEHSSGFPRLDQAALETVRQWRFVPGRRAGVAQDMRYTIPVTFTLE